MNGPPYSVPPCAPTGALAAWKREQDEHRRKTAAGQLEALRAACGDLRDAVLAGLRR